MCKVDWNIGHRRCPEKMSSLGGPKLKKNYLLCFKRYPFLWNFFQWQKTPNETRANAFKSENNLQLIFWTFSSLLFRPLKQICSKTRCGSFCKNWAKKIEEKTFQQRMNYEETFLRGANCSLQMWFYTKAQSD